MTEHADITTLVIGGVQRPTPELIAAVDAAVSHVEDSAGDPVVVLHIGAPDGEAAPWDGDSAPLAIHLVNRWERALRRLERTSALTIAVAQGRVCGPAFEALLSSDYRIASSDLVLTPFSAAGEPWPGMLVHRLATQISVAKARRLVLFGEELPAARAAEIGVVDEIGDDLPAALAARIEQARGLTGSEVAIRRRLLLEAVQVSFEDALGTHLAACDRTLRRFQDAAAS